MNHSDIIIGESFETRDGTVINTRLRDLVVGDYFYGAFIGNGMSEVRVVTRVTWSGFLHSTLLDGSDPQEQYQDATTTVARIRKD